MHNVAWNHYVDKPDVAERALKNVVQLANEVLPTDDELRLSALSNLASLYLARGASKEAEPLLTEALAGNRRVRGAEHPSTLGTMDNLASVLGQQGRLPEAETMRREILAARLRTQGREHQATNSARSSVAQNLLNQGSPAQLAEAERLFLENLVISQRVHGARARFTNADRANLGNLYDEEAPGRSGGNVARGADRPPRIARTEAPGDGERDRIARLRPASRTEVPRHRTDPSPTGGDPRREIAAAVASGVARNLLGASLAGQRRFAEAEPLVVGRYEQMVAQRASMAAYFNGFLTGSGQRVVDLYARGVSPRRPRSGGRSSPRADARSA